MLPMGIGVPFPHAQVRAAMLVLAAACASVNAWASVVDLQSSSGGRNSVALSFAGYALLALLVAVLLLLVIGVARDLIRGVRDEQVRIVDGGRGEPLFTLLPSSQAAIDARVASAMAGGLVQRRGHKAHPRAVEVAVVDEPGNHPAPHPSSSIGDRQGPGGTAADAAVHVHVNPLRALVLENADEAAGPSAAPPSYSAQSVGSTGARVADEVRFALRPLGVRELQSPERRPWGRSRTRGQQQRPQAESAKPPPPLPPAVAALAAALDDPSSASSANIAAACAQFTSLPPDQARRVAQALLPRLAALTQRLEDEAGDHESDGTASRAQAWALMAALSDAADTETIAVLPSWDAPGQVTRALRRGAADFGAGADAATALNSALWLLGNLAADSRAVAPFLAAGGAAALVAVLSRLTLAPGGEADVHALLAAVTLARQPDGAAALLDAGGVPALVRLCSSSGGVATREPACIAIALLLSFAAAAPPAEDGGCGSSASAASLVCADLVGCGAARVLTTTLNAALAHARKCPAGADDWSAVSHAANALRSTIDIACAAERAVRRHEMYPDAQPSAAPAAPVHALLREALNEAAQWAFPDAMQALLVPGPRDSPDGDGSVGTDISSATAAGQPGHCPRRLGISDLLSYVTVQVPSPARGRPPS